MNNSEAIFGHKLSARTYYTLLNHGIKTKEQVLESYIRGDLLRLRNFGKVSHNEVFDWLDKEIDSKLKPMRFVTKHDKPKPKPLTPVALFTWTTTASLCWVAKAVKCLSSCCRTKATQTSATPVVPLGTQSGLTAT